ncbi:MAG TPA: aspartate aminotransferase family protein [Nitrososphaerales archaeon]|nr:aspartate aminotransferase family protein [Nitrososphaerales archaeon]
MNEEDSHLVPLYQKFPIEVVRGDGALVYDGNGREFIDLSGGYGVAIVGHSNKRVADAIADQAHKLITCHGSLYNDSRRRYLSLLSKYLPAGLSRVFFSNSGAEANEAALKFARKATGRSNIVAFTGSYHGKTYGALSATWNQKYRKPFEPLVQGVSFSPFGNLEKAKEVIDETVAAVIVEPIQGESGIHVPPDDFLPGLRETTRAKGALLIFDEVQSGFGRTGKLWACENWGVSPDFLTASKGIAGGFPFAITATNESISSMMKPGEHTSTFGGNPLGCAAAYAALDFMISEKILQKAISDGEYFRAKLESIRQRHPSIVREVRGKGLMIAAELKIPVKDVIMAGFDYGLILLYSGLNILRFLPPLVISRVQIDTVASGLDKIFSGIEKVGSAARVVEKVALD